MHVAPGSITLFPADTVGLITSGFMNVVTPNLPVIISVMAVFLGIKFVLSRLRASTKGKA